MRGAECGQQDAVLPENKEQGVLSSEVLAATPDTDLGPAPGEEIVSGWDGGTRRAPKGPGPEP